MPGPLWGADGSVTGVRPKVRGGESMRGKGRGQGGAGPWVTCAGVSGGPGQCWQTQNKRAVREHLGSQERREEPDRPQSWRACPSRRVRSCCSGVLGRGRTVRDCWTTVHLAPQRGCRLELSLAAYRACAKAQSGSGLSVPRGLSPLQDSASSATYRNPWLPALL